MSNEREIMQAFWPVVLVYFVMLLGGIVALVSQIMLCIGIYKDAKALGRTDGLLFALLTAFLGGIPSIIYIAIRLNPVAKVCCRCGMSLMPGVQGCPSCGTPVLPPSGSELAEIQSAAATRGKPLKTSIILYIIATLIIVVAMFALFASLSKLIPMLAMTY